MTPTPHRDGTLDRVTAIAAAIILAALAGALLSWQSLTRQVAAQAARSPESCSCRRKGD